MNVMPHPKTLAGAACLALLPLIAPAQEDFDPARMEEVVRKYGTPGKEHKILASWVGTWKTENTYWMTPEAPPMKSIGQSRCRMLMKGRYLSELFSSESPEFGKFEGRATVAYDRLNKEYIHTWIDTMNTGMMISRGKASEGGKSVEFKTVHKDSLTMQELKIRMVSHIGDPRERKLEMFLTYPGKEEFKHMQIVYTKVTRAQKNKKKNERKAEDSAGS